MDIFLIGEHTIPSIACSLTAAYWIVTAGATVQIKCTQNNKQTVTQHGFLILSLCSTSRACVSADRFAAYMNAGRCTPRWHVESSIPCLKRGRTQAFLDTSHFTYIIMGITSRQAEKIVTLLTVLI